jgi:hypothetical protein
MRRIGEPVRLRFLKRESLGGGVGDLTPRIMEDG